MNKISSFIWEKDKTEHKDILFINFSFVLLFSFRTKLIILMVSFHYVWRVLNDQDLSPNPSSIRETTASFLLAQIAVLVMISPLVFSTVSRKSWMSGLKSIRLSRIILDFKLRKQKVIFHNEADKFLQVFSRFVKML